MLSLELESQPVTLSKYLYKHKNRFRLSVLSMKLRDVADVLLGGYLTTTLFQAAKIKMMT